MTRIGNVRFFISGSGYMTQRRSMAILAMFFTGWKPVSQDVR